MRTFGVLVAGLLSTTAAANQWTWDFDGHLDARGASGAPLVAFGTYSFEAATLQGAAAQVARFEGGAGPDFDARFQVVNPVGPNGPPGAVYTNRYTLIMDVRFAAEAWTSLFQTNAYNENDGDAFVNPAGGLGISGDYGDPDNPLVLSFDGWHRVALVIDTTAPSGSDDNVYRCFVDGVLQNVVQSPSGWGADGRFSLEGIFHLFADNNGETQDVAWINSFQMRDYAMSDAEVASLGGPAADGIPGAPPPPTLRVGPLLQSATPQSIWIVWETDGGDESRVDYGPTPDLGQVAYGSTLVSTLGTRVHHAQLTGLLPDARYYYRAQTGAAASDVLHLRTPAVGAAEDTIRFVVVSDTQRDDRNPDKLEEIVNAGILTYVADTYGVDVSDALDFAILAGDLVHDGNTYSDWQHDFFSEMQNLLGYIPLYPALGNHENNSPNYFNYFRLPENGTAGYLEHWYYVDCGNVRIISLDTNTGYRVPEQLGWLEDVLSQAAAHPYIDFVVAEFHYPYKSELWTPGELDYSGQIVARLEAFSAASGKPSAHFFGHTHGYSRGQSRDALHVWMNVASGEGNIDYWGEFPNADYDEFQRSFPTWGFIIVELTAGPAPTLTMHRISRGNEIVPADNELTDTLTIRTVNAAPAAPVPQAPPDGAGPLHPDRPVALQLSAYSDPDADAHLETHVQLTTTAGVYEPPAREAWVRFENWYSPPGATGPENGYYSVNTVADSDITRVTVDQLAPETTYYWRARYRDDALAWSGWSPEATFFTGSSSFGENLLHNPGAEEGVGPWTILDPPLESLASQECGSERDAASGERFFAVGGVCADEGPHGVAFQSVDVAESAEAIDAGLLRARFGGQLGDYSGSDEPSVWLVFKDGADQALATTAALSCRTPGWTWLESTVDVPPGTRVIEFHMAGTRHAGTDNDSYLDDLLLSTGTHATPGDLNCDGALDLGDINPFVLALANPAAYALVYPHCDQAAADINADGVVDIRDVNPFVFALVGGD